ncbi:MAG: dTDP-4-dehydrorhamnose 3,5-epimerase [Candidatus Omnitrophica bacterium]|nr:dTDP-4-dehydrorhamnose 3,5-epimerase [Candidatus Omnitrophota bacterium]
MKFTPAGLPGLMMIEPKIFRDKRGFFMESYSRKVFSEHGIPEEFVQNNISHSARGTLRGLHYQLLPHAQGKLVSVTVGSIFDVAVDIRKSSPAFGKWFGCVLDDKDRRMLYIPPGFAHGFCVLSREAECSYQCTDFYRPSAERSIHWNDAKVGIRWPTQPNQELISEKDNKAPDLKSAENNFN